MWCGSSSYFSVTYLDENTWQAATKTELRNLMSVRLPSPSFSSKSLIPCTAPVELLRTRVLRFSSSFFSSSSVSSFFSLAGCACEEMSFGSTICTIRALSTKSAAAAYAGTALLKVFERRPPMVGPTRKARVAQARRCDRDLVLSSSVVSEVVIALLMVMVCFTSPTMKRLSTRVEMREFWYESPARAYDTALPKKLSRRMFFLPDMWSLTYPSTTPLTIWEIWYTEATRPSSSVLTPSSRQ
mmetsp:Transcript_2976/g.10025  ORF Transcript_2976/g.10025 Transcript_2976/m.10025 type:complete len:242 (-) Transcript_2976:227-952(-)